MGIDVYYVRMKEAKLKELVADPRRMSSLGMAGAQEPGEDLASYAKRMLVLDNYWDSLHFLLTGKKFPTKPAAEIDNILSIALAGAEPVGPSLSFGPARSISAPLVEKIAKALKSLQFDDLVEKYGPDDFKKADLYKYQDFDEEIESLEEYFPQLQEFYLDAAKANEAVLTYII